MDGGQKVGNSYLPPESTEERRECVSIFNFLQELRFEVGVEIRHIVYFQDCSSFNKSILSSKVKIDYVLT